jgi:AraC family transcriptional regulator of adaptative response / DNA-3-methyladenine glycosylase II
VELPDESCYRALVARDARFDGAFFVGVRSTGIYCRPVCPARTPRPENCRYYRSPAAAEQAGFRPCLRCRPELAPGSAPSDAGSRLGAAVRARIEAGALLEGTVGELAASLEISDRHLRRIIEAEYGATPIALAQTQRLLGARRLLAATDLSITEVALASGFGSVRRFNSLVRARYGQEPSALRDRNRFRRQDDVVCEVAYRPPYDWNGMLAFLAPRACPGVETVTQGLYYRTVAVGHARGWIAVADDPSGSCLTVRVSASLAGALPAVLQRVRRLFDVHASPADIDAQLGELAKGHPGLRVPGAFCGFETALRAILGQQISVRAATTLAGRFAQRFGEPVATILPGLTRLAPTAEPIAEAELEELCALGLPRARAHTIRSLARAAVSGTVSLEIPLDLDRALQRLEAMPGIGPWTVQYVAMRVLAWPDAFPSSDLGIRKALGLQREAEIQKEAERWRPWRAYAAMHLWQRL